MKIASERNINLTNRFFIHGSATDISAILKNNGRGKYNRVVIVGALLYINDNDIDIALHEVEKVCEYKSIICIREPIGLNERLTLENEFSDELDDEYNAVYRTRDELVRFFNDPLFSRGFSITEEGFLFEQGELNNRKETSQYYFIIERGMGNV